jgi:hypothetical protein
VAVEVLVEVVVVAHLQQLKLGGGVEEGLVVFAPLALLPPRPRHHLDSKEYLEGMFAERIP